tara:strand:+ start:1076 stop:1279 length:204 start_codon:yes stop_codon:yes gene_type:complete
VQIIGVDMFEMVFIAGGIYIAAIAMFALFGFLGGWTVDDAKEVLPMTCLVLAAIILAPTIYVIIAQN